MRSPLSAIVFSLELLKHELGAIPDAAEKTLKMLGDETERFKGLLSYLLDANKIQTGAVQIQKKECELRSLIERTIDELRPLNPTHTIIFKPGDPVTVTCDEARITQALINLISNAI